MEVIITNGDIKTIEWLENAVRDMKVYKDMFSTNMQENLHNAEGFLHRIKTNALTAKKLDPQQR
jgi:hypothetical protein